ncbi:unnamed protein product [Dibothriocephalus latus]|uniref:Uncharacterized protein n=1 Tax=Dibothriocephalus latus TaxID=60516 RepID=A0A3P7M3G1_DIBLA|nr:unnamed protein product [Dibothriocephalus latus]
MGGFLPDLMWTVSRLPPTCLIGLSMSLWYCFLAVLAVSPWLLGTIGGTICLLLLLLLGLLILGLLYRRHQRRRGPPADPPIRMDISYPLDRPEM